MCKSLSKAGHKIMFGLGYSLPGTRVLYRPTINSTSKDFIVVDRYLIILYYCMTMHSRYFSAKDRLESQTYKTKLSKPIIIKILEKSSELFLRLNFHLPRCRCRITNIILRTYARCLHKRSISAGYTLLLY